MRHMPGAVEKFWKHFSAPIGYLQLKCSNMLENAMFLAKSGFSFKIKSKTFLCVLLRTKSRLQIWNEVLYCESSQKLLPKRYYLSFINRFFVFFEEIMSTDIKKMKHFATGADFFFLYKFKANLDLTPPLIFHKNTQKWRQSYLKYNWYLFW